MANLRQRSKEDFDSNNSIEHINAGSLQRIADATERMAGNYTALQWDKEYYERRFKEETAACKRMARRIAALQGVITKMKKAKL